MPDKTYITSDGRKFSVKEEAIPEFIASFPGSKPYRDPFWEKASEGYNEAARKDAAIAAMSPKDKAAQVVGEFETIKMPEVKERSVLGSPLRIDMSEYSNAQKMKKDVQTKTEEFRRNVLMVRPEDRAEIISSIETKVKDPLLKPELLRIAKSNDYISPGDLELGRENESSTQSDMIESAGLAAEKLGRQGLWNIPKFVVDTRRGHKITKENVDDMSQGFANSFLGYDIPDKDKKEVMREMLGYNQSLSGIIGQGLVDTPAFLTEMATIGLFTGGAGAVPKLTVEGAAKVTRARKIYNGLVKIAESGLESGGKFATAGAAFKGQTDPGEVGHNTLAGFSFHTGEAATQAVAAHSLGKWLMGKQGASARIANNTIKLIGSAASGSIISAGIGGDLSMENIAREAPINVMFAFLTHGSPVGKKKYKEFVIQNGIKEGIIKSEDAPVYEHYLDKWLDKKSINEILVDTKDVLTKVDAAVVAGSKVRMNYDWPLEEVDKNINKSASEKETKDGKEEKDQKEEMLKFSHWGEVPTGMTDPTKIGTGIPGADQPIAKRAGLNYTSAVVKGAPYTEKRVQKGKEYEIEIPKSRVYDFNAENRANDPFWQAAVEKTGGENQDTMIQYQKDVIASGKYDAIKFTNESGDYQTRIYVAKDAKQVTRIPNAPDGNFLNVGMVRGTATDKPLLTEKEITSALPKDVKVEVSKVIEGGDEPTMFIKLSRALDSNEMAVLAEKTEQQAIPQFSNREGVMHGKDRMKWSEGEFKPEYFKMPDGKSLLDHVNEGRTVFGMPDEAVALKNASVDERLQKMGLPSADFQDVVGDQTLIDQAKAALSSDPLAAEKTTEKYLADPTKPVNAKDSALLLIDWTEKSNEWDALATEYEKNPAPETLLKMNNLAMRNGEVAQMLHDIGSETGRALRFRRVMMQKDYSLKKMVFDKVQQKGRSLNAQEMEETRAQSKALREKANELAAKEEMLDTKYSEKATGDFIGKLEKEIDAETKRKATLEEREKKIADIVSKRKEILSKIGKSGTGAAAGIPTSGLQHLPALILNHAEELTLKGAWKTKDLFDRVRNELKGIGLDVTDDQLKTAYFTATGRDIKKRDDGSFSPTDVHKIAKSFVMEGVKDVNDLIDKVHAELVKADPEITRRQAQDMMSGYGKYKMLSKDAISKAYRDFKGQMQAMSKIEDMMNGMLPKLTGIERRTPSEQEQILNAQVNELKKTLPTDLVRKDGEVKTAMDRIITRLENALNIVRREMATGERVIKERKQMPLSDRAKELKAELDFAKEEADKLFGRDKTIENKKKYIKGQISKYEGMIERGEFEKKPTEVKDFKLDDEYVALSGELAELQSAWSRDLMEYKLMNRSALQKTWDVYGDVLDLTRAIKTGIDLSAPLRQGAILALTHPVISSKAIPKMLSAWASEKNSKKIDNMITLRKNYAVYNKSGLHLAERGHSLNNREEMARSKWADKIPLIAGSQRAYSTYLNVVRADVMDALIKSSMKGDKLASMEELKAYANFVNVASGRGSGKVFGGDINGALNTFNKVFFAPRFVLSRFQYLLGQPLYQNKEASKIIAKEYAKSIVGVTAALGLSALAKSASDDSEGSYVEDLKAAADTRDNKSFKIRLGNSYVDLLAGLQQQAVVLTRALTGETIKEGDVVALREGLTLTDSDKGYRDMGDLLLSYGRSKLNPAMSLVADLTFGTTYSGMPLYDYIQENVEIPGIGNVYDYATNTLGSSDEEASKLALGAYMVGALASPMNLGTIYEAMKEEGLPLGTILSIFSTFGASVSTYKEK